MTKQKYMPEFMMDELCPTPLDHPDEFIQFDGTWMCAVPNDDGDGIDDEWPVRDLHENGMIFFQPFENYGIITGTVKVSRDEDGCITLVTLDPLGGRSWPCKANCFYDDAEGYDSLSDDPNDIARTLVEWGDADDGTLIDVATYWWGAGVPWQFHLDPKPHFKPIQNGAKA